MGITAIGSSTDYTALKESKVASSADTGAASGKRSVASGDSGSAKTESTRGDSGSTQTTETSGTSSGSTQVVTTTEGSAVSEYYDPADTNKDGVVSTQEEMKYYNKHPEKAAQRQTTNSAGQNYTRQGLMVDYAGEKPGSFEASA